MSSVSMQYDMQQERERILDTLGAIRETVNDFDFRPDRYPELLVKYKCEPGTVYQKIRARLKELVGEL